MKEEGLPVKAYHTGGVLTFKNQGEVTLTLGNSATILRKDISPSRLYASDGTTLKPLAWSEDAGVRQVSGQQADGDRIQAIIYAEGTETKLSMTNMNGSVDCKWDLYINGVKDGATTYDNYAASLTATDRTITLTEPIVAGFNLIEFRVNGKNASSSSYYFRFIGGSVY